uniref:Uncharacterized protein n=1 Tax=Romanomermis culicivorax TaxID=13658 RepID=A0A915J9L3_ROMCU
MSDFQGNLYTCNDEILKHTELYKNYIAQLRIAHWGIAHLNCMALARSPGTAPQTKLASSNKIFTCNLNNMSDESTKTDILTYVKTLENRIRKLERDRNSSHYSIDDQNLSSLSPPTSTSMVDCASGFFGDDDPFLNDQEENTVRT